MQESVTMNGRTAIQRTGLLAVRAGLQDNTGDGRADTGPLEPIKAGIVAMVRPSGADP